METHVDVPSSVRSHPPTTTSGFTIFLVNSVSIWRPQMVSKQNAFYSADVLDSWNGNSAVTQVFPGTSRLHTSVPKILMIVLDGFRYDGLIDYPVLLSTCHSVLFPDPIPVPVPVLNICTSVYVCMYVCMCVCMYVVMVCMHVRMYV